MDSFIYNANPSRVVFGQGSLSNIADELHGISCARPLLVCGRRQLACVQHLEDLFGSSSIAGVFSDAVMHTPVHVTERAMKVLQNSNADSIVTIGGGSQIGLGKALGVRTGLPHIAIPTTYAGSEMTTILGETSNGRKVTRSDRNILPSIVIYDVDLTLSLPPRLSATSGVNAIAHAVEALYAENANPVTSLIALEGISALSLSLPLIVSDPNSVEARNQALYGAWLCSTCAGSVSMGLHHKLCHTLGGSFNLPHSETHANVLPHSYAYNFSGLAPDIQVKLAEALPDSIGDAANGIDLLLDRLNIERGLKQYGMKAEDIPKAANMAMDNAYSNPRKVERSKLEEVIRRAWAGEHARADL